MINFFRKIRHSLVESGSAKKYALYALGEIALVVTGILIALQINNWNEMRKYKAQIIQNILSVAEDIRTDNASPSLQERYLCARNRPRKKSLGDRLKSDFIYLIFKDI